MVCNKENNKGECVLIEVKAASGNTKSTKTIVSHLDKYHVYKAIKFGDYNIGYINWLLTLPLYMSFFYKRILILFLKR